MKVLARDLAKAALHPIVEPREGLPRSRPYIREMGSLGGTYFLEVTFINTFALSYERVRAFDQLTYSNVAWTTNYRRFQSFIASCATARIVTVPISTLEV